MTKEGGERLKMVHISPETVSKEETCPLSSLLLRVSGFGEQIQMTRQKSWQGLGSASIS